MSVNKLTLNIELCTPTPSGGYYVHYRPVGDVGAYRVEGPFTTTPIEIIDTIDDGLEQYEGFIQSDCGGGLLGNEIPFTTTEPGPGYCYQWLSNNATPQEVTYIDCAGGTVTYTNPGSGQPGNIFCGREIISEEIPGSIITGGSEAWPDGQPCDPIIMEECPEIIFENNYPLPNRFKVTVCVDSYGPPGTTLDIQVKWRASETSGSGLTNQGFELGIHIPDNQLCATDYYTAAPMIQTIGETWNILTNCARSEQVDTTSCICCVGWLNVTDENATIDYLDCNGDLVEGVTITPGSDVCAIELVGGDVGFFVQYPTETDTCS